MTELIAVLAWPLVAAFAICGAIGVAWAWHHPTQARERLLTAERRLAEHSAAVDELKRRIGQLEASREMSTAALVGGLRGLGR